MCILFNFTSVFNFFFYFCVKILPYNASVVSQVYLPANVSLSLQFSVDVSLHLALCQQHVAQLIQKHYRWGMVCLCVCVCVCVCERTSIQSYSGKKDGENERKEGSGR